MIDDVQWFVGIDWATQSHRAAVACLTGITVKRVREERQQVDRTRRRFQQ
jgi:hypothetical protein